MRSSDLRSLLRHRASVLRIAALLCFLITSPFASISAYDTSQDDTSAQAKGNSQTAPAPSGTISGHVFRADDGRPISKAIVTLFIGATLMPDDTTRTEADGSFSFSNVSASTYLIKATRSGYVDGYFRDSESSGSTGIELAAGQTRQKMDIRLGLAGVIAGRVADSDGEPVYGLQIFAIRPSYSEGGRVTENELSQTRTDDRGEYRLANLKPGSYLIRAGGVAKQTESNREGRAWTFAAAYFPGFPRAAEAQSVKVAAGAEVDGIDLQVVSENRKTYKITAHFPEMSDHGPQVSILLGDETIVDAPPFWNFELKTVTFAGLAPGKYTVVFRLLEALPAPAAASGSASETRSRFPFRIRIGSAAASIDDADVKASIQLSDAGQLSGKLVMEKTKNPDFSETNIDLEPRAGLGSVMENSDPQAETKPDGTFTITNIIPGSYFFTLDQDRAQSYVKEAICDGKDYTQHPFDVEAGTKLNDCRVALSSDVGTITGAVSDDDKPLPGLYIVAIPQSRTLRENPQYTSTEKTNADGHFEMKVIPGDYFIFAVRPNDQDSYYALDFAEHNLSSAERVSVKSGDAKTVTLKPAASQ